MTDRPIWLEADTSPDRVSLRVVGRSAKLVVADFDLKIVAGTNRSVHRSSAAAVSPEMLTLSAITVSASPDVRWTATLRVEAAGVEPYTQTLQSR